MSSLQNWFFDFRWINLCQFYKFYSFSNERALKYTELIDLLTTNLTKAHAIYQQIWHRGAIFIIKSFKYLLPHGTLPGKWSDIAYLQNGTKESTLNEVLYKFTFNNGIKMLSNNPKISEMESENFESLYAENFGISSSMHVKRTESDLRDLIDIRESESYMNYVEKMNGFINFNEDGYKSLAKEYKRELKYSAGH